jgi:hypothetical protein
VAPTLATPALPRVNADPEPTVAAEVPEMAEPVVVTSVPEPRTRSGWWRVPLVLLVLLAAAGSAAVVALHDRAGGAASAAASEVDGVTFTTYTHPTQGWTAHYPRGWRVEPRTPNALDFREPGTGRYLRVGFTTSPGGDAKAAWESGARAFARTHGGYEQIRIDDADYRGYDAAVWEYRWRDTNVLHAVNLGFVTGGRGYALNFQTREKDWKRSQALFEAMRERFEPAA